MICLKECRQGRSFSAHGIHCYRTNRLIDALRNIKQRERERERERERQTERERETDRQTDRQTDRE